ncbi:hypothetical protein GF358_04215 [Candidatus Woesearchaeota archaeon]|nr:hypothetical protein [Candidatus Woesearchaeota archaeon]
MKNLQLIVLSSLVLLGIFGTAIVMQTQKTGQLTYEKFERPPVFSKVLTKDKCETIPADTSLPTTECIDKGRWICTAMYPMTPGGAENYCSQVCMNRIIAECEQ